MGRCSATQTACQAPSRSDTHTHTHTHTSSQLPNGVLLCDADGLPSPFTVRHTHTHTHTHTHPRAREPTPTQMCEAHFGGCCTHTDTIHTQDHLHAPDLSSV